MGGPAPKDGYHAGYITDLAAAIIADRPELIELPENEQMVAFREERLCPTAEAAADVLALFRYRVRRLVLRTRLTRAERSSVAS